MPGSLGAAIAAAAEEPQSPANQQTALRLLSNACQGQHLSSWLLSHAQVLLCLSMYSPAVITACFCNTTISESKQKVSQISLNSCCIAEQAMRQFCKVLICCLVWLRCRCVLGNCGCLGACLYNERLSAKGCPWGICSYAGQSGSSDSSWQTSCPRQ